MKKNPDYLKKGTILNYFGNVSFRVIGLLNHILMIRLLGAEIYGVFILAFVILSIIARFSRLGLDNSALKFIPLLREEKNWKGLRGFVLTIILFSFFFGILISVLIFFTKDYFSILFNKPYLKICFEFMTIIFPFFVLNQILGQITRGFQVMKYYVISINIVQPLLQLIFLIFFYISFGKSIVTALLAWEISVFVSSVLSSYFVYNFLSKLPERGFSFFSLKKIFSVSFHLLITDVIGIFLFWTDIIMVGLFMDSKSVGIYSATSRLAQIMIFFLWAINSASAPLFSKLSHRGNKKEIDKIFKTTTRWSIIFSTPLFIFLIFTGKEILKIFFNIELPEAYIVLLILLSSTYLNCITGPIGTILMMSDNEKKWAGVVMIGGLINLILNFFFIPLIGIKGAALSTLLSIFFTFSSGLIQGYLYMKIFPYNKETLKIIFLFSGLVLINFLIFKLSTGYLKIFLIFLVTIVIPYMILIIKEKSNIIKMYEV